MVRVSPANIRRSRRFGDFLRRAAGFESEQVRTIDGHRVDVRSAHALADSRRSEAYKALVMTRPVKPALMICVSGNEVPPGIDGWTSGPLSLFSMRSCVTRDVLTARS